MVPPPEKRRQSDRRRLNWRTFRFALWRGRRRGPRRKEDRSRPYYVDIYEDHWLLLWSLGIPILCVVDAFLTLRVLERGGTELNPVMAFLLDLGTPAFFYGKYLVTAIAVVIILLHVHHRVASIPVRPILPLLFGFYAFLIGYEIWLLSG